VFPWRHLAAPWYYWRGTARRGGVTAEGWRNIMAAERLRDAVPAATPRDITEGRPTVPQMGVVKVT